MQRKYLDRRVKCWSDAHCKAVKRFRNRFSLFEHLVDKSPRVNGCRFMLINYGRFRRHRRPPFQTFIAFPFALIKPISPPCFCLAVYSEMCVGFLYELPRFKCRTGDRLEGGCRHSVLLRGFSNITYSLFGMDRSADSQSHPLWFLWKRI